MVGLEKGKKIRPFQRKGFINSHCELELPATVLKEYREPQRGLSYSILLSKTWCTAEISVYVQESILKQVSLELDIFQPELLLFYALSF